MVSAGDTETNFSLHIQAREGGGEELVLQTKSNLKCQGGGGRCVGGTHTHTHTHLSGGTQKLKRNFEHKFISLHLATVWQRVSHTLRTWRLSILTFLHSAKKSLLGASVFSVNKAILLTDKNNKQAKHYLWHRNYRKKFQYFLGLHGIVSGNPWLQDRKFFFFVQASIMKAYCTQCGIIAFSFT